MHDYRRICYGPIEAQHHESRYHNTPDPEPGLRMLEVRGYFVEGEDCGDEGFVALKREVDPGFEDSVGEEDNLQWLGDDADEEED